MYKGIALNQCLLALTLISIQAVAQPVSIRADKWFPINGTPGSDMPGFQIELAQRIFGVVDYRLMPWGRAIDEVGAGNFDCVVGSYIDDTPGFLLPKENWGMDQTGVFTLADDSWSYQGAQSLLTRKVGVIHGYDYDESIDGYIKTRKDVFKALGGNDALKKNIRKLDAQRIDTLIESVPVMQAKARELGLEGRFKLVGALAEPQPLYIACGPSSRSKELISQVDTKTKQLRESGELEQIMQKYGLTDWK